MFRVYGYLENSDFKKDDKYVKAYAYFQDICDKQLRTKILCIPEDFKGERVLNPWKNGIDAENEYGKKAVENFKNNVINSDNTLLYELSVGNKRITDTSMISSSVWIVEEKLPGKLVYSVYSDLYDIDRIDLSSYTDAMEYALSVFKEY